jgi:hypothetical protein
MKKNPINDFYARGVKARVIILALFLAVELFATSYECSVSANKERAYVNEAIYLNMSCQYSDRAEYYAVVFDPVRSDENITITMLSERSMIENGKKIVNYEFVAFVHRAGVREFAFEAVMKSTTKESIENTVIGRDNGNYVEYQNKVVALRPFEIEIMETKSSLVGDFSLKVKSDPPKLKAFTPYHLEFEIEGVGNLESFEDLRFDIEGVKIFQEDPKKKLVLTPDGYRGSWSQKFVFVSEKDFALKPFVIEYFNLRRGQKEELRFDGVDVTIEEGYTKESLLDIQTQESGFLKWEYLYYLLSFVAGFLLSKIKINKRAHSKESLWCKKIKSASSLEALALLLVLENSLKYEKIIKEIEANELTNLAKVKRLICH